MPLSFRAHIMAVDRVEHRLRRVTAALDAAGIPYAVIGGNAVAAWVGRVDPAATRATKDVDLLVRRTDAERVNAVMASLGFQRMDMRRPVLFLDPEEPSKRSGVHLVWAGEKVRPCTQRRHRMSPKPSATPRASSSSTCRRWCG